MAHGGGPLGYRARLRNPEEGARSQGPDEGARQRDPDEGARRGSGRQRGRWPSLTEQRPRVALDPLDSLGHRRAFRFLLRSPADARGARLHRR
jgi:hypothetical protein